MELKRCVRCGKFYASEVEVCKECEKKDFADLSKLKGFFADNYVNGVSKVEISAYTGISARNLNRYLGYEEFSGITDFLIESYKDMDIETAKTRFYFKGKDLQFIKTIYQTVNPDTGETTNIEELLKTNIEYNVEDNIFEIPSEYAES